MPEKIECTFEGFWSEVGGSIAHPLHHILRQMSECDDLSEDYRVWHGTDLYVISKENIRKYFETHDKPARPMSEHEELLALREKVKKLEKEVKRADKKGELGVIKLSLEKDPAPVIEAQPEAEAFDLDDVNVEERPKAPPRDVSIPPPSAEQRKKDKMSLAEIQSELAADLEGKGKKVSDKAIEAAKKQADSRKRK